MRKIISKLIQPTTLVIIGALARILPHPANFTPIAAIALFGGSYLNKKQALTIPFLTMLITDWFIGFDSLEMRVSVYGSFLISILIGFWLKKHMNIRNVILGSLFSSIVFFLITNFSVWAFGTMYPKSMVGLFESYFFAIPFFKNTILGDLVYSGLFFGGYEFIKNLVHKRSFVLEK